MDMGGERQEEGVVVEGWGVAEIWIG